jgi:hypothetical protein
MTKAKKAGKNKIVVALLKDTPAHRLARVQGGTVVRARLPPVTPVQV